MELVLNLVWVIVAVAGLVFWLRDDHPSRANRSTQLVVLAMLVLILFPIISVSDDLWAAQNPAEADSSFRRDELAGHLHTIAFPVAIVPHAEQVDFSLAVLGHLPPRDRIVPTPQAPARHILFSRPPPAA